MSIDIESTKSSIHFWLKWIENVFQRAPSSIQRWIDVEKKRAILFSYQLQIMENILLHWQPLTHSIFFFKYSSVWYFTSKLYSDVQSTNWQMQQLLYLQMENYSTKQYDPFGKLNWKLPVCILKFCESR